MHCARFLNFIIIISLYRNYLPLEKDVAIHLNNLEFPSPKDALSLVLLKLAQWFLSYEHVKSLQTDGQTDRQRQTVDGSQAISGSALYTLFNFLFFSCKIMSNWYYTQNSIREGTDEQKTK